MQGKTTSWLQIAHESRKCLAQQVVPMSASITHAEALFGATFPTGIDTRWETENRKMWNEREHESEERELVYEISWISELGVWRRFLLSQRKIKT